MPERDIRCPRCNSDMLRVSDGRTPTEFLKEFFGFRPLRCERCIHRFSAFVPALRIWEPDPEAKAPITVDLVSPRPAALLQPATSPLVEIAALEDEWRERLQPEGLVEETLCAQLTHATWHLRCLQRAELEAIATAAKNRSFNGNQAVSLMTWRRAAEESIRTALTQLQEYRQLASGEVREVPQLEEVSDLLALMQAVQPTPVTERAASASQH